VTIRPGVDGIVTCIRIPRQESVNTFPQHKRSTMEGHPLLGNGQVEALSEEKTVLFMGYVQSGCEKSSAGPQKPVVERKSCQNEVSPRQSWKKGSAEDLLCYCNLV
jgi:hypothetical protein